jgi:uncharacterized surface protein with fasciclin (FAS1) repeats
MTVSLIGRTLLFTAAMALGACGGTGGEGNETGSANTAGAAPAAAGEGGNLAAAAPATGGQMAPDKTIGANLAGSPDHSTFAGAVKAAGLEETLTGPTVYTIFAPSNAAFQKLPGGTTEGLLKPEAKGQLTGLLTYHIVPGVVAAADLARAVETQGGTAELATMAGSSLKVTKSGDALVITDAKGGQARIVQPDMVQSNGVLHVVDTVLMPG